MDIQDKFISFKQENRLKEILWLWDEGYFNLAKVCAFYNPKLDLITIECSWDHLRFEALQIGNYEVVNNHFIFSPEGDKVFIQAKLEHLVKALDKTPSWKLQLLNNSNTPKKVLEVLQ